MLIFAISQHTWSAAVKKKARWQAHKWEKVHLEGDNLFEQSIPERGTQMKNRSDKTQDEDILHHVPLDGIQRLCF